MKILFCSPSPLVTHLGGPKVLVELIEELRLLGRNCKLVGPDDIHSSHEPKASYSQNLCRFLQQHAAEYDIVDYDHGMLPYSRKLFSSDTLFVARSVLLGHHFEVIPIPHRGTLRSHARILLFGKQERMARNLRSQRAHKTIQEADLANVSNYDDKAELIKCGIPSEKIIVLPFGISEHRRLLFDAVSSVPPASPVVAFVGTFDYRKGAKEFPRIVKGIVDQLPQVRFRLIGTAGLFQTIEEVKAHFPRSLRERLDIIPRFAPDELPLILASCSVGIFPSHIEGMGFGVLEMLAASIPVIAYDAPGPPMLLPPEYLVSRGDADAMSAKVVSLLRDSNRLTIARIWAKEQSQTFQWKRIAEMTSEIYQNRLENLRNNCLSC